MTIGNRLTNEEPDEVRVMLAKKVIQIPVAGESAFIVFGNMPLHGYRLSVRCLKLKKMNVSLAAWQRNRSNSKNEKGRKVHHIRVKEKKFNKKTHKYF